MWSGGWRDEGRTNERRKSGGGRRKVVSEQPDRRRSVYLFRRGLSSGSKTKRGIMGDQKRPTDYPPAVPPPPPPSLPCQNVHPAHTRGSCRNYGPLCFEDTLTACGDTWGNHFQEVAIWTFPFHGLKSIRWNRFAGIWKNITRCEYRSRLWYSRTSDTLSSWEMLDCQAYSRKKTVVHTVMDISLALCGHQFQVYRCSFEALLWCVMQPPPPKQKVTVSSNILSSCTLSERLLIQ